MATRILNKMDRFANLDLVIPITAAAHPAPRWNLLDRFLVTAEARGLPSIICISKVDLVRDSHGKLNPQIQAMLDEYLSIGYQVILTSVETGEGLDDLRQAVEGKLAVFLGKSGVGKTSLLNALQPGLGKRVGEVSKATGKGRHTTTAAGIFPLASGGAILDTPGIRAFGLGDPAPEEVVYGFPEMRPFIGRCRFSDCNHAEEPGCAIRKAVMAGSISPRRYKSFMRMQDGD
jgi:ribosome biogenesis GTPase